MALNIIQGAPGAGKSYIAVNELMRQWLESSNRPIYTNLPLEVGADGIFEVVRQITRNPARRAELSARIHILEDKFMDCGSWVNPETGKEEHLGARHGIREFWYFTAANSVIFLDELAELYDAKDRSSQPETFATYCRLHRHYKDDFYGFAQDRRDVLAQFRRLVQYVWTVRNSSKENIFGWWALRGIKWPVQFFIVKVWLAAQVMEAANFEKTGECQESFNVWPSKKGFRTYRSFSKAGALGWKETAASSASSTDVNPGWWFRFAGFIRQSGVLVSLAGAAVVALYMGYRGFQFLLHPPADLIGGKGNVAVPVAGAPLRDASALGSATNLTAGVVTNSEPDRPATERLLLVTPQRFRTTEREVYVGDEIAGLGTLLGVYVDGVRTSTGAIPWRVLFPFQRRDGGGRGDGDIRPLRGVGSDSGGQGAVASGGAGGGNEHNPSPRGVVVPSSDKVSQ